jgi:hypothetical protein
MRCLRSWVAISALLLLLVSPGLVTSKTDPESRLIRVICIGESYYPETRLPLLLRADPRIRYQAVPANWYESSFQTVGSGSRKDALKFMRQYIPRNYDRYVEGFDVQLLSDFEVDIITPEQFVWMEQGVREEGMGLGKYEMNYDPGHFSTFDRFISSAVYPALPADLQYGQLLRKPLEGIYAVEQADGEPHPMVRLPGMKNYKILGSGDYGYEIPRPGAIVIAKFIPKNEDALIVREYGKGKALACLPGLDKIDAGALADWPYVVDFWINHMWYLADLEIPEDVELVHTLRTEALTYVNERSLSTAVIEFVEKFGAPTKRLYDQLYEVDDVKRESDGLYMDERYTESLAKLQEAFDGLKSVAEESIKLKESALFWVYMVEWFTVSGTCILTGFVLWTLMVRRRLYREVKVTRAA